MLTCILPGFSPKNLSWAQEVVSNSHLFEEGVIFEWKHWTTQNPDDFSPIEESQKVITKIGKAQFNIIAKSLGTLVAMHSLENIYLQLNKLIFCGIPLNDMTQADYIHYELLSTIPAYKIKVFQNEQDTHGTSDEVKRFIFDINPKIEVITTPRSDHDYPFYEDFEKFIKVS